MYLLLYFKKTTWLHLPSASARTDSVVPIFLSENNALYLSNNGRSSFSIVFRSSCNSVPLVGGAGSTDK